MPIYATKKKNDIFSKKIPKNTKFDYLEPTIDTGASLSRRIKEWEEFKEDYKITKNEIFKRIKPVAFVKLILQLAEMNGSLYLPQREESIEQGEPTNNNVKEHHADTSRSSFNKFVCGYGEMNKNDVDECKELQTPTKQKEVPITNKCPYLLLDVRLKEEYDLGHIIKAQSYPASMLGRSVNFESPDMLNYKNKPGSVIILYDNDESQAPRAATTLVERGYENILMLSGGIKVCWKKFPQGLITGRLPKVVQNLILSTCGKSNFQKKPARRTSQMNDLETGSNNSDTIDGLSRNLARLGPLKHSQERLDFDDSKSMISTARTTTSIRTNGSRYSSKKRFELMDFEPYCLIDSRKRCDLNDQEEFTMQDLAHLSIALDAFDSMSRVSTTSSRARSCGTRDSNRSGMRQFKMK